MKKIKQFEEGEDIPSNAKYVDLITVNNDPVFFYEVPIKERESQSKELSDKETLETIERVIKYLNAVIGSKYTSRSKAHASKIRARLNEGAKAEDFKKVIDNMCSEWLDDPKWSKFLRPETLFSNKFWGYLSHKSGASMTQEAFNELDNLLEAKSENV